MRDMRTPPHNFEAEMALLGAILSNNRAYSIVQSFLRAEDFMDPRHAEIFDVCAKMIAAGGVADPITLKNHFDALGTLAEMGGSAYLAKLAASTLSMIFVEDYGRMVFDRALRRQMIAAAAVLSENCYDTRVEATASDLLGEHQANLTALQARGSDRPSVTIGEAAQAALEQTAAAMKGERDVVMTGSKKLDKALGGLERGDFIIIAGRPGMGKSALAGNLQFNMATRGKRVYAASLEMSNAQNAQRAMARLALVSATAQRTGALDVEDYGRLIDAKEQLAVLPWRMNDGVGKYLTEIEAEARRMEADIVFVDHMGILGGVRPGERHHGMFEKMSAISNDMKRMAKRLNVPVVGLSQLSRDVERREDKRPTLADLRQSGELEQDADVVMFVYRDAYYLAKSPGEEKQTEQWKASWDESKHKLDVIVAKQRSGPEASVEMFFSGKYQDVQDEQPDYGNVHEGPQKTFF